ncbi:MAG: hypothetical protein MUF31_04230 [Akkermansiaceae bacterium]|nr:hypothetical protein [Akkermansiaceae bacterium]
MKGKRIPDPDRYASLKAEAERWRGVLAEKHRSANSQAERVKVEDEAREFLNEILPAMMDCWMGTPWNFHGTAAGPGEKPVACGYFVATLLKDAGFRVDRFKLAKQPSQLILRTFLPKSAMTLRAGVPYETFTRELKRMAPGIRIVGLDTHVGFLVCREDGFRFVHSSGSKPWCVVDESEEHAEVLKKSSYRVHGCLTSDPEVVRGWLAGKTFRVP